MNYSLNVLHLRVNSYTFVISLFLVLSMNHNVLATTYDIDFERRPKRYSYIERVKPHQCLHIDDFALHTNCESWSCWESQLRDFTRIEFLRLYNQFRADVVTGKCVSCKSSNISTMIQLEWHWRLEEESQKAIKNCPIKDFRRNMSIDVDNNAGGRLMSCEMVATSFSIQGGSQDELLYMLPFLLNENYLYDFNENKEYRRNMALFIGCSFVSRISIGMLESKGAIGHLLCYYCSKEKSIQSNQNTCPKYTQNNKTNEFPELCKSIDNSTLMPCETKSIPCVPWDRSYSWRFPRSVEVDIHVKNGSIFSSKDRHTKNVTVPTNKPRVLPKSMISVVPLKPRVHYVDPFDFKFCAVLILVYVLVIALMVAAFLLIYKHHLIENSRTDT